MNKDWVLTQESFDALLAWLDQDREQAGREYEEIRVRLIRIFTCRGCLEPEDLADETINRVTKRLKDIEADFEGERAKYFYGVANKVHQEYLRRPPPPLPPAPPPDSDQIELEDECLERCMEKLAAENRFLVMEYYREEKKAKIDHRRQLAEKLGIALNALRIRAYRTRVLLLECVNNCVHADAV